MASTSFGFFGAAPPRHTAANTHSRTLFMRSRFSQGITQFHEPSVRAIASRARHESDGSRSFIFCGLNLKVCNTLRRGGPMPDPLPPLVDDRSTLLRQIAELGDFQPGSITSATRRCGSSACHCAKPNDAGHGPHFQLTQKVDGKTVTQNLPSLVAVRKAESEIDFL